jgi:hypothetical protein
LLDRITASWRARTSETTAAFGLQTILICAEASEGGEKSGCFVLGMLGNEGLDKLGNLLLLAARELGGGLKDQLQAAFCCLLLGLGGRDAE